MDVSRHDIVIVGGGAAGLRAAIEVAENHPAASIAVVSKVYPMRSHTVSAEGGTAAITREDDSLELHGYDTVKADVVPDERAWAELRGILKEHVAARMIWEREPAAETARKLRDLGLAAVVFDPCANVPPDGDFLTVLRRNLENLR